jgi:antitoxin component of MazEF toxin-antitoxin module
MKVGNSHGLIFDAALMDLAHLKPGDQVNVEVHEGGAITVTPMRQAISPAKAAATARRLIKKNSELFRRLA